MRVHHPSENRRPRTCAAALVRLDDLPLRPATARLLLGALPDDPPMTIPTPVESSKPHAGCELDPGWILAARADRPDRPACD